MGEKSYANAWLALLPQVHLPNLAAQAVARECAKYADWATGENVRPTRKRLAWNLNTSQDTVKVAIGVCIAHGILKVVAQGGVRGPRQMAAVYCLSIPDHLASPENLATFPDANRVVIVHPKTVSGPKYPANQPDKEAPAGSGLPAGNAPHWALSGEPTPPAGGNGLPSQWATDSPLPSINPPGHPAQATPTAPSRGPAAYAAPSDEETSRQTGSPTEANGLMAACEVHPGLQVSRP